MSERVCNYSKIINTDLFLNNPKVENVLLGESSFIKELRKVAVRLSQNKASFLLSGETGTGKRLFAETVHYLSGAKPEDFYSISCKACNDNQLENFLVETFVVPAAENSCKTLYIRDIEHASDNIQEKIFSLLNDKDTEAVRFIFSSAENLEEKVNNGEFLGNLCFMISNVYVNFVPLRQRREDLLPMIGYFFKKYKKETGIKMEGFSEEAIALMKDFYWKANLNELSNAIERAFIVGEPPCINISDLGLGKSSNVEESGKNLIDNMESVSLKAAVDSFKKNYITKVLEENNWNQTKTAKILGIQRTYVIKLINDLGIKRK